MLEREKMKKFFYMGRDRQFTEVELLEQTSYKRTIKFSDGTIKNVHPEGIAWGNIYPRLFKRDHKPSHVFYHHGRVMVNPVLEDFDLNAVPKAESYNFQPFLKDVIDSIHSHENVLLTGGTGVGKTTHILQMASRIGQPVLRINFNGETRMSDLIGKVMVLNGETVWVDGVLPMAMRMGYWLLLDELDFADPAVLSLLHPVLEEDPMLVLKENSGEIVRPHENFRLFATANSIGAMSNRAQAYAGTNEMNEAFLDRWQVVLVGNLPEKDELKVVKAKVPGIPTAFAKKIVRFANVVRNNGISGDFALKGDNFSTRKVLAWARKAALHRDIIIGAKLSWLDKLVEEEQEVVMRILTTHFGTGRRSRKVVNSKGRVIKMSKASLAKKKPVRAVA
jgi:cobaltochelatase CobS